MPLSSTEGSVNDLSNGTTQYRARRNKQGKDFGPSSIHSMSAFTVPIARLVAKSNCLAVCRAHASVQSRQISCSSSSVSFAALSENCLLRGVESLGADSTADVSASAPYALRPVNDTVSVI